jgi:hypothetical protein
MENTSHPVADNVWSVNPDSDHYSGGWKIKATGH